MFYFKSNLFQDGKPALNIEIPANTFVYTNSSDESGAFLTLDPVADNLLSNTNPFSFGFDITFSNNVNMVKGVRFDIRLPLSTDASKLCLAFLNTSTGNWECEDSDVSLVTLRVVEINSTADLIFIRGFTSHFTAFAIVEDTFEAPTQAVESSGTAAVIIGVAVALVVLLCVFIGFVGVVALNKRRKLRETRKEANEEQLVMAELNDIDHTYLENVTIDNKIGSGNFVSLKKKQIESCNYFVMFEQGAVYHGELDGHDIALKKITGSNEYENLKKEAGILKEFRHPNIVKYFGLYKAKSGDEYIVCEFANGGSLKSALETIKVKVPNKQLLKL